MKILITGGSGLLGKSLLETAPKEHDLSLTYNKNWRRNSENAIWYALNVRNRADIFELFELVRPNVVIHCASIGSVDYTEDHYLEVRDVNVGGLSDIIDAANGYKSKIVYISTNAVFSGKNPPYDEGSSLEPINSYGVIKREAERLVKDKADKWLIFRPFLLYGWPYPGGRTNWAVKIAQTLRSGNKQHLVNDITWMPTYAPDLAGVIWALLAEDQQIYNVAAPERVTLYEFGLHVCDAFDLDKKLLVPIESKQLSVILGTLKLAKRPKDTTYDLSKLAQLGFMLSDTKTGLEKMKEAEK